jgi:hypothetical protein
VPFLVDGNNLLGRLLGKPRASEEEKRVVVRRIAARVRSGGSTVILFFDGEPPGGARDAWLGRLSVRYGGPRSADDVIIEAVERAKARVDCHVVTDDRGLAERARTSGARALSTSDFLGRLGEDEPSTGKPGVVDVADWVGFFSDDKNRLT